MDIHRKCYVYIYVIARMSIYNENEVVNIIDIELHRVRGVQGVGSASNQPGSARRKVKGEDIVTC